MEVKLDRDGLTIETNSDFEKQWLEATFKNEYKKTVFLKYGTTPKFFVGLKIKIHKE